MNTLLELQELPAHPGTFQLKSLPWIIISRTHPRGWQVSCFSRQVLNPNQPEWLKRLYPPLRSRRPHTVLLFEGREFETPEQALAELEDSVWWKVEPATSAAKV